MTRKRPPPKLDTAILLKLSSQQKAAIEQAAARDRRSASDWMRLTLLDAAAQTPKSPAGR
jgi:uncharacterized protein (DUF1778 family)